MLDILTPGFMPTPVPYPEGWALQRRVHADVVSGTRPDTLILLEHAAVYTAGKRTQPEDMPDNGQPVVTPATLETGVAAVDGPAGDHQALASKLSASEELPACVAAHWLGYALATPDLDDGSRAAVSPVSTLDRAGRIGLMTDWGRMRNISPPKSSAVRPDCAARMMSGVVSLMPSKSMPSVVS